MTTHAHPIHKTVQKTTVPKPGNGHAAGSEPDAAEEQFHTLAEVWRRETSHLSSPEDKFLHPAYQGIIGMGQEAVPLILGELAQRPGHWFAALKAITGENPMRPEHAGNLRRMTEDWLAWGERNGYSGIRH